MKSAAQRPPSRYTQVPVVTSIAPNTVTCRFLPGVDLRDITPGEQPWLYRVRYRRSPGPARWCPRRRRSARVSRPEAVLAETKPTEFAQKMNGTSILVERLYTG